MLRVFGKLLNDGRPTFRCLFLLLAIFSLSFSKNNGQLLVAGDDIPEADKAGFEATVAPFFKAHCLKCHGPKRQSADLALDKIDGDLVSGKDVGVWQQIFHRLNKGEMPPKGQPRPDAGDVKQVLEWIRTEVAKAEKAGNAEPVVHVRGNEADHDALFNHPELKPLDAPPRIWRISPFIYDGLLHDLTRGRIKIANPFSLNNKYDFQDYAEAYTVDESTAIQLIRNAKAIVQYQTRYKIEKGEVKRQFGATREFMPLFDPKKLPSDEDMEEAIREQFDRVVLREPTDKELQRFTAFMKKNIEDAGRKEGVRTTLAAILLMPEVIYRREIGDDMPDGEGKVRLTPREIAFAIAYALTDERPDNELLKAAETGKLETKEGVKEQVKRYLSNPKIEKPRILRFIHEYFGYPKAEWVFKDRKKYKNHEPRVLVSDTDLLVQYILEKDQNVLQELLTTNLSYVNYRKDKRKGVIPAHKRDVHLAYNLDSWPKKQPTRLPGNQRAGILTQPSWLVAMSANDENHAILRGKWVREKLLGGTVPDLPITVDAQLPDDPEKTLREKMMITKKQYCWQCHQRMNPLGLTFEIYNHLGQYRAKERDEPVDASGAISDSGENGLDGDVDNALQMINKLAKSTKVKQVFVRHVFRYFMGRNETLGDAGTLREAYQAYEQSGGSMKALITSILTSESFLYRVPAASISKNEGRECGRRARHRSACF